MALWIANPGLLPLVAMNGGGGGKPPTGLIIAAGIFLLLVLLGNAGAILYNMEPHL